MKTVRAVSFSTCYIHYVYIPMAFALPCDPALFVTAGVASQMNSRIEIDEVGK